VKQLEGYPAPEIELEIDLILHSLTCHKYQGIGNIAFLEVARILNLALN
jgi:hypothetical protein